MDDLYRAPTSNSPEVDFRYSQHTLSLRGESYPEHAAEFYGEILRQLRAYLDGLHGEAVTVNVALAYFNSSSAKMLFNLTRMLGDAARAGQRVALHWFHDEEDDTIREFGEELRDDFPDVEYIGHPVSSD